MQDITAKVEVVSREKLTEKGGKPYRAVLAGGTWYTLFKHQSAEAYRHLSEDIRKGDTVDMKVKQSGDFWNILDIMKVQQESVAEPEPPEPEDTERETLKKQEPERVTDRERFNFNKLKQGAIIGQSTLGYAIETIGLYDRKGMTAEKIDEEIERVWRQYYKDVMKTLDE